MKVFVVTWGSGVMDYDGREVSTYCGCAGIFTDRKKAEEAMLKDQDNYIDTCYEPYEEVDKGEEAEEWVSNRTNHEVYGSVKDDYLEVDWGTDCIADTNKGQYYVKLEEAEIQ